MEFDPDKGLNLPGCRMESAGVCVGLFNAVFEKV
jgi:hypothetical protein